MAGYRQFHTKFWKDEWLIDLDPLERYLFSYLFTNELSSISGLYKLPFRVILNETGLTKEFTQQTLSKFQDAKKIYYADGVMWVVNMKRHHKNASPRTMVKVNNDVQEIPECAVKTAYLYYEKTGIYSTDTVSILNSESVSVSESVNESRSRSESNAAPASNSPSIEAERIFQIVTKMPTFPQTEMDKCIPAIQALQVGRTQNELIVYLQTFFDEWTQKRHYGRSNCAWLYDWAISGEIPQNGKVSKQKIGEKVMIDVPGIGRVEATT